MRSAAAQAAGLRWPAPCIVRFMSACGGYGAVHVRDHHPSWRWATPVAIMPPNRRRHPKKDVEQALRFAEASGWTVLEVHRGHRWGLVTCGSGCGRAIFCTPREAGDHARDVRRAVTRCPHCNEET